MLPVAADLYRPRRADNPWSLVPELGQTPLIYRNWKPDTGHHTCGNQITSVFRLLILLPYDAELLRIIGAIICTLEERS